MTNGAAEAASKAENEMTESLLKTTEEILPYIEQESDVIDETGSAAFSGEKEEIEFLVPTGRYDQEGRQIKVKTVVIDPRRPEIGLAYLVAEPAKKDEALLELWKACVVSPKAILDPVNFKKTTTSFKQSLTFKLLKMLGFDSNFFEEVAAFLPTPKARMKSSTQLRQNMASPPQKSVSGSVPVN